MADPKEHHIRFSLSTRPGVTNLSLDKTLPQSLDETLLQTSVFGINRIVSNRSFVQNLVVNFCLWAKILVAIITALYKT